MRMIRPVLLLFALTGASLLAQTDDFAPVLAGRVEGRMYVSPTGLFRIPVPVLPELGGTIKDTENVVTFQDNFSVHVSIGVFQQDATQRWELSTRGPQDYLGYFFTTYVMPDFRNAFPGGGVESAGFLPKILDGVFIAYTLLPGGSMFGAKRALVTDDNPIVAKRGNLIFVRNNVIYVISTELAERVTERSTYKKTTQEENVILRDRLLEILQKMEFPRAAAAAKP
ncbi:MAG: hypothetical protein JWM32_892 [Verrucomicrobia bacterium]|nr:hypothetical protein [Verrucomicrobiota bacterium]